MSVTKDEVKYLFNGYNNVNDRTVNDLIDYWFSGDVTANSISQATTAGLVIGRAGQKVGFFGTAPVIKQTVSAQAFTTPTDLPTAIIQIGFLQTVVNNLRTGLGSTGFNLFT